MSLLKRKDIMLATPFSESRLLNQGHYRTSWTPPYIIQPKLNGERCRSIVDNGRCLLLSSTDSIISTVPHINQGMLSMSNAERDGELYVHGWTFSEIHSVVSTTVGIHPRAGEMQYHIFDIVNDQPQLYRMQHLSADFALNCSKIPSCIKKVPFYPVMTHKDIMDYYDSFIDDGYEGFILREISSLYIRKRSQQMMKFKPKSTDIYPILTPIEAVSESGTPMKMVGAFMCIDEMGTSFKVGAGKLSHAQRAKYWEMWLDTPFPSWKLRVEYQVLSDKNNVPLFSRAVEVII